MPFSAPPPRPPQPQPNPPQQRSFRVLLASEFVSLVGDRLAMVALIALVFDLTRSVSVVAGLMLVKAVPAVLLGGLAGSVVDRLDRKAVMVGANALQGLLVLLIPATSHLTVAVTAYLAMSIVNQFFLPARAATIPDLVPPERLMAANSRFGLAFVTAIAVGPAVGGWVADRFGLAMAFYVDSATFLIPALAVATLVLPTTAHRRPTQSRVTLRSLLTATAEGMRHARTDRSTGVALTAATAAALVIAVMSVLGVVVAQDTLGLSVAGYGLMMSAMGAGMLVAALTIGSRRSGRGGGRGGGRGRGQGDGRRSGRGSERAPMIGLLLTGGGLAILPWLTTLLPALACSAVIGAGVLTVQISTQTTLQSAPPDLRARVISLGQSVTGLAQLTAIVLTAALTGPLGASWVLCGTGIATAAVALALSPRHSTPTSATKTPVTASPEGPHS